MKFLIDNQLPPAIARYVEAQGYEARHVLDLGLGRASDSEIWQIATEHKYIIITKDIDFYEFAARKADQGRLLWLRLRNSRKRHLILFFERNLSQIITFFEAGGRILEVREQSTIN